jgi:hypothetical protein
VDYLEHNKHSLPLCTMRSRFTLLATSHRSTPGALAIRGGFQCRLQLGREARLRNSDLAHAEPLCALARKSEKAKKRDALDALVIAKASRRCGRDVQVALARISCSTAITWSICSGAR